MLVVILDAALLEEALDGAAAKMRLLLGTLVCCLLIAAGQSAALPSCEYESTEGHALYGENIEILRNIELLDCQQACNTNMECKSLDFNKHVGSCFLSDQSRETAPDLFGRHSRLDYYEKQNCDTPTPEPTTPEPTTPEPTTPEPTTPEPSTSPDERKCQYNYRPFGGSCYSFVYERSVSWQQARRACMDDADGARLVIVDSQQEMDFLASTIIDLLRENDMSYGHELWWVGASRDLVNYDDYESSGSDSDDISWLDGTEVLDELWYPGEPNDVDEKAVNLLIRYGEHGLNDLASYEYLRYICEYPQHEEEVTESEGCRESQLGKEYTGSLEVTVSGRTCQRWSSQYPHEHYLGDLPFPDGSSWVAENYCRNPDNEPGGPWCYTTDPDVRWEYCDVPSCTGSCPDGAPQCDYNPCAGAVCESYPGARCSLDHCGGCGIRWFLGSNEVFCDVTNEGDCRETWLGTEYTGTVEVTLSGRTCQRWTSQYPHEHSRGDFPFPDGSSSAAQNYCRNPDNEPEGPWCYTTDPEVRWEYCDVPMC